MSDEKKGEFKLDLNLDTDSMDGLMGLGASAHDFLERQKGGAAMFAEDVELARDLAGFVIALARELTKQNPRIAVLAAEKLVELAAKDEVSPEVIASIMSHDCETCDHLDDCPLSGAMTEARTKLLSRE